MWPFFGVPLETLEPMRAGYIIVAAEDEVRLCDTNQTPSDPCDGLYVVVDGSVSVVTSDSRDRCKVESKLSRGAIIGASRPLM